MKIAYATLIIVTLSVLGYVGYVESFKAGQLSACKQIYTNLYKRLNVTEIDQASLTNACEAMVESK